MELDQDLYYAPDRDAPMRGLAYIIHGYLSLSFDAFGSLGPWRV